MIPAHVDILLVEDNPSDAELVLASLHHAQTALAVHVVHDGAEALDFLFSRGMYAGRSPDPRPGLVLLDIKLPKVDGFGVLLELKASSLTRAIPVVMLTSSNVERDVARCYLLGANSYVQKPVDFERFRETIGQLGVYWLRTNAPPPRTAFTPDRA